MNDRSSVPSLALSIAAVERDTGLSKDTLRVWERRYGFPQPDRDVNDDRIYPQDQVEKLRLIKRLMDAGHRPGKIISMDMGQLRALSELGLEMGRPPVAHECSDELNQYLEMIKRHEVEQFRRAMSSAVLRGGLHKFVVDIVAPLTAMVGDAWSRGYFEIFEEHLYTESIQVVLRNAINTIPQPARNPTIILTTFPNELHGLGLLMAEAVFSLEGARCLSLGTQTPIWDIALAVKSQNADIIALSFSPSHGPNFVLDGLKELRSMLPNSVEIWCGGQSPVLKRRPPEGVHVISSLDDIPLEIVRWRDDRARRI